MEPSLASLEEVLPYWHLILHLLSSLFTFRIIYFRLYSGKYQLLMIVISHQSSTTIHLVVFDDITSDTIWRTNRQKIIHGWKLIITASTLALT